MAEQAAILNKLCRPLELRIESCDPAPVVEEVLSRLGPRSEAKRLKINSNLEPGAPRVSFDPRLIGEALEAIILRAVNASPEDGEIRISLRRQNEALRIEIKDNGAPLDDERRLGFFDPLAGDRLNRTALGLAMARRIIEKHGGHVSARADEFAGTIVEVTLQIADCNA
jgi:signal transduction histidine kinase